MVTLSLVEVHWLDAPANSNQDRHESAIPLGR
jgi:hypothetical protein